MNIHRNVKFLLSIFIASTLAVLNLGASAKAEPAQRPSVIRITTLKGPTGVGMLELIESKSLKLPDGTSIPLEIEIAGGPEILDARVLGGQADFVTIPVNQAARLYTKGAGLQLAAVNVWGVLYVLSSDPGVTQWSSLKGKKILASGRGSTTDVSFRELASRNGLNPDGDLNLDYSFGHVEVMQLAASGRADTVLLPEPFVSRALRANPQLKVVIDLQASWKAAFGNLEQAQGGIAVSSIFAQSYPEITRALLAAYERSITTVLTSPDAPARIAAQDFGLDAPSAQASLPRMNLRYVGARAARAATQAYLQVLFSADPQSIGGSMPTEGFWL